MKRSVALGKIWDILYRNIGELSNDECALLSHDILSELENLGIAPPFVEKIYIASNYNA